MRQKVWLSVLVGALIGSLIGWGYGWIFGFFVLRPILEYLVEDPDTARGFYNLAIYLHAGFGWLSGLFIGAAIAYLGKLPRIQST